MAFGLVLTPVLIYVFDRRGLDTPTEETAVGICVIVFLIGCLFALCGLLRCEPASTFEKVAFEILKYFAVLCVVSGTLLGVISPYRFGFIFAEMQLDLSIAILSCGLGTLLIAALYAIAKCRRAAARR